MKKRLLFLLISILTINCYSQVVFEKGYYINNSDQKIDCLIKNVDWRNNPENFEYKLSENSETKNANIKVVKEFGIYTISKYIRSTVKIDRSSESVNELSKERSPIYKEEQLFLKVLNEGKANLYLYKDTGLSRYFYNKENSNIEQLVFKKYETSDSKLGINNYYRQQLRKDLKCPTITLTKIEKLVYKKNSLIKLFNTYNKCSDSDFINYENNEKKDLFNLTLRPRLNYSSLTFENTFSPFLSVDFGNKLGFGFGIEAEFILPFNKNKWAITIEPTFQSFTNSGKTKVPISSSGSTYDAMIDYSSVELPISFRHYLFLNNNSKVFINASYVLDLILKSSTEYRRFDDTLFFSYNDRASQSNFALGVGYKFNDQYGFEMRYQTSREVIDANRSGQSSNYNTFSLIFGYSLF